MLIFLASCESAFITNNESFEYCFNCAGETKSSQTDAVYREGIYKLSLNCASIAAKHNISRYVEVSSGHFVASEKVNKLPRFYLIPKILENLQIL